MPAFRERKPTPESTPLAPQCNQIINDRELHCSMSSSPPIVVHAQTKMHAMQKNRRMPTAMATPSSMQGESPSLPKVTARISSFPSILSSTRFSHECSAGASHVQFGPQTHRPNPTCLRSRRLATLHRETLLPFGLHDPAHYMAL